MTTKRRRLNAKPAVLMRTFRPFPDGVQVSLPEAEVQERVRLQRDAMADVLVKQDVQIAAHDTTRAQQQRGNAEKRQTAKRTAKRVNATIERLLSEGASKYGIVKKAADVLDITYAAARESRKKALR